MKYSIVKYSLFCLLQLLKYCKGGIIYSEFGRDPTTNQPSDFLSRGFPIVGSNPNGRQPYKRIPLYTKTDDSKKYKKLAWEELDNEEKNSGVKLSKVEATAMQQGFGSSAQEIIFWEYVLIGAYDLALQVLNENDYDRLQNLSSLVTEVGESIGRYTNEKAHTTGKYMQIKKVEEVTYRVRNSNRLEGSRVWIVLISTYRKFQLNPALKKLLVDRVFEQGKERHEISYCTGPEDFWGVGLGEGLNVEGKILDLVAGKMSDDDFANQSDPNTNQMV